MPTLPLNQGATARKTRSVQLAVAEGSGPFGTVKKTDLGAESSSDSESDATSKASPTRGRSQTADATMTSHSRVSVAVPVASIPPFFTQQRRLSSPAMIYQTPMPIIRMPVRKQVTFAASPVVSSTEVTPYAQIYGIHPRFFDFDRSGSIAFTPEGAMEFSKGTLQVVPTPAACVMVVQGSPGSPVTSLTGPIGSQQLSAGLPGNMVMPRATVNGVDWCVGEQVLVCTDDGVHWMDGVIIAAFPQDCEAEGYSVPGGTVKVSYELGIKWVMPQNLGATLRKRPTQPFVPGTRPYQVTQPGGAQVPEARQQPVNQQQNLELQQQRQQQQLQKPQLQKPQQLQLQQQQQQPQQQQQQQQVQKKPVQARPGSPAGMAASSRPRLVSPTRPTSPIRYVSAPQSQVSPTRQNAPATAVARATAAPAPAAASPAAAAAAAAVTGNQLPKQPSMSLQPQGQQQAQLRPRPAQMVRGVSPTPAIGLHPSLPQRPTSPVFHRYSPPGSPTGAVQSPTNQLQFQQVQVRPGSPQASSQGPSGGRFFLQQR